MVPQFAEKWRTLGIFREEDTEKLHAQMNAIMRDINCVQNSLSRLKLGIKRINMYQLCRESEPVKNKKGCFHIFIFKNSTENKKICILIFFQFFCLQNSDDLNNQHQWLTTGLHGEPAFFSQKHVASKKLFFKH